MSEESNTTSQATEPQPAPAAEERVRVWMREATVQIQAPAIECTCACGHKEIITLHDKDPAVAKGVAMAFVQYQAIDFPPCRGCGKSGEGKRALLVQGNTGPNRHERRVRGLSMAPK